MHWTKILTPLAVSLSFLVMAGSAQAVAVAVPGTPSAGDEVLLDMHQAFRKKDRARLAQLLPQVRGHALEPWAAYWALRVRLEDAQPAEIEAFLQRWAGTYQEDRLRNDWLLLLGQRRDWARFAALHPQFRMGDDREVRCYALSIAQIEGRAAPDAAAQVRDNWFALRDADDGCTHAAGELFAAGRLAEGDVWRKARLAIEANRVRAAQGAVAIVAPKQLAMVAQLNDAPTKFLRAHATAPGRERKEIMVLALIKLATSDPDNAAQLLDAKWGVHFNAEERNWTWAVIGKQAALRLSPDAVGYFAKVGRDADLNDDLLAWKVRAALRAGQWDAVRKAVAAMSPEAQKDSAWAYWKARALLQGRVTDAERAEATALLRTIAGPGGFYEQLALEALGERVTVPPAPAPLTAEEKAAARANPALNRGLYAILIGLRREGVREWNYATNLHEPGGMGERELLAAADFACHYEVWDRCINTSERTQAVADFAQRYPMPFEKAVVGHSREVGLDPAYVYGLIRQESRFIMDARSGVGASGLMQVMPATARWTAKKIGLAGFTPDQLSDRDTNITIGTAYLKLALDDFAGSMPLAAAAYNAGPGRPRSWRNGPVLDAAIWAENVPFSETRDYVKKVLANTTTYAAILTGKPQSLRERLGTIGPRDARTPEVNKDLP
jgi:soluble lytic murein transglycosylase